MCARTRTNISIEQIREVLKDLIIVEDIIPSYNLSPTEQASIIAYGKEGLSLIHARFGLIPAWAKDSKMGASTVNARSETVEQKPAFKTSFTKRHCLVPVSGFYEWRVEGGVKQPYLFSRKDGHIMWLAGLWDYWTPPETEKYIISYTILTTEANSLMLEYHDRMPVILEDDECYDWLDSRPDKKLLDAYPSQFMAAQRVDRAVNNVRHKQDVVLNSL